MIVHIDDVLRQLPEDLTSAEDLIAVVQTAVQDEEYKKESWKGTFLIEPPGQFWSKEVTTTFDRELLEDESNPLSHISEVQEILELPDSSDPMLVLYDHRNMTKGYSPQGFGKRVRVKEKLFGVIPTIRDYRSSDYVGIKIRGRYVPDERAKTLDMPYWNFGLYHSNVSGKPFYSTTSESRTYHNYLENGGGFFTGCGTGCGKKEEVVDGMIWLLHRLRDQ